jgi:hypothetical protein
MPTAAMKLAPGEESSAVMQKANEENSFVLQMSSKILKYAIPLFYGDYCASDAVKLYNVTCKLCDDYIIF